MQLQEHVVRPFGRTLPRSLPIGILMVHTAEVQPAKRCLMCNFAFALDIRLTITYEGVRGLVEIWTARGLIVRF